MIPRTPKLIQVKTDEKKKYLLPLSDVHLGAPTCDFEKAQGMIQWAIEKNAWIILLGDIIENATRNSVGAGVYEQTMNPQEQQDLAVEFLRPAAEKGLILGAVTGNHETRASNDSGVNITKNICDILGFPYLGYSIFIEAKVGDINYTLFGTHGAGGSIALASKINSVTKLAHHRHADVFMQGHVHELWTGSDVVMRVNKRNRTVEERKRYYVLTGAYLKYQGSYGEMKNFPPSKTGTPRIRLDGNKFDVHVSI